jgi:hypothetical protein
MTNVIRGAHLPVAAKIWLPPPAMANKLPPTLRAPPSGRGRRGCKDGAPLQIKKANTAAAWRRTFTCWGQAQMSVEEQTELPRDHVAWWRDSFQRDTEAFERAHGRRPKSLFELVRWLQPLPARALKAPEQH